MAGSFGSAEILQVADAVAREKGIQKQSVIEAMENSIAVAARKKYGYDRNIHAIINPSNGDISLFREFTVVEAIDPEDEDAPNKLTLADAKVKKEDAKIGDTIREPLPPIDLGRVAAQTAKQVIMQKVRDAERERQFNDFKGRIGEIVNGIVKRVEFGNVIVDLGRAEAIIRRDQSIRGETFRVNDRIRAYVQDVRQEPKGPQIFLSRTAPEFMAKLFSQEVPEIYDNVIEIKGVAREPGSRAKIAVFSKDPGIDPVGSCVGVRGSRVQAVINELQGEKIDIIQWSSDTATFLIDALSPAEVSKVIIDEESRRIEVVVPEEQLSLAIGRRGQNVRLASQLTGWHIDIFTEAQESTRRAEEFNRLSALFMEALNVEEVIAHLLVTEGFTSVEDVAFIASSEIASIEGFDESIAEELQARAKEYLDIKQAENTKRLDELKVEESLRALEGLPQDILVELANKGIRTLDDFADLSREEFEEIVPGSGLKAGQVDKLIMAARAHWFEGEEEENASAQTSKQA